LLQQHLHRIPVPEQGASPACLVQHIVIVPDRREEFGAQSILKRHIPQIEIGERRVMTTGIAGGMHYPYKGLVLAAPDGALNSLPTAQSFPGGP